MRKMAARLLCYIVAVSLIFWLSLAAKYDGKQITYDKSCECVTIYNSLCVYV